MKLLRFVEGIFCKVFYRLFSSIPSFFPRNPLPNKLQFYVGILRSCPDCPDPYIYTHIHTYILYLKG